MQKLVSMQQSIPIVNVPLGSFLKDNARFLNPPSELGTLLYVYQELYCERNLDDSLTSRQRYRYMYDKHGTQANHNEHM